MGKDDPFHLHETKDGAHLRATSVALAGKAALLVGPSGSGKSSLAIEMLALGAGLVADDVTELTPGPPLMARAPKMLPQAIEARGVGLIQADLVGPHRVAVAMDLTRCVAARMPQRQEILILGSAIPLLHRPAGGPVAAILVQYLKQTAL